MPPRLITPPPDPFGDQETADFDEAWSRAFYMVLERRKDNDHVERMIYGGNRLAKAQAAYTAFIKLRPHAYATLQQRMRVLERSWRPENT